MSVWETESWIATIDDSACWTSVEMALGAGAGDPAGAGDAAAAVVAGADALPPSSSWVATATIPPATRAPTRAPTATPPRNRPRGEGDGRFPGDGGPPHGPRGGAGGRAVGGAIGGAAGGNTAPPGPGGWESGPVAD